MPELDINAPKDFDSLGQTWKQNAVDPAEQIAQVDHAPPPPGLELENFDMVSYSVQNAEINVGDECEVNVGGGSLLTALIDAGDNLAKNIDDTMGPKQGNDFVPPPPNLDPALDLTHNSIATGPAGPF